MAQSCLAAFSIFQKICKWFVKMCVAVILGYRNSVKKSWGLDKGLGFCANIKQAGKWLSISTVLFHLSHINKKSNSCINKICTFQINWWWLKFTLLTHKILHQHTHKHTHKRTDYKNYSTTFVLQWKNHQSHRGWCDLHWIVIAKSAIDSLFYAMRSVYHLVFFYT